MLEKIKPRGAAWQNRLRFFQRFNHFFRSNHDYNVTSWLNPKDGTTLKNTGHITRPGSSQLPDTHHITQVKIDKII